MKKKEANEIEVEMKLEPFVVFKPEVIEKVGYYLEEMKENKDDKEFQTFLSIEREEEQFTINDIYLPEQEVTGATTELSNKLLAKFISKNKGLTQSIKGGLHSHANMGVFWSTTDNTYFEEMLDYLGDWVLGIVINNNREILIRIDYKFGNFIFKVDNVPWRIESKVNERVKSKCIADIQENIKETKTIYTYNKTNQPKLYPYEENYGGYEKYPDIKFSLNQVMSHLSYEKGMLCSGMLKANMDAKTYVRINELIKDKVTELMFSGYYANPQFVLDDAVEFVLSELKIKYKHGALIS